MDWLVLGKAVPNVDEVARDVTGTRLERQASELFLNPFDQRAVRVALDRREAGERVSLVSMGPPRAAEALRDSLALGLDRAILVSDPALLGSDSLVTARVLAAAVRRLDAPLVLTGRWSTDSETGQVPAQLAGLLGRMFLPAARGLSRGPGTAMVVDSDTETGWVRHRAPLPLVVAVGEKIAPLRKPTEEARAQVDLGRVERWGLADLGLAPQDVGLAGSPTVVARVREVAPRRTPEVFADGSAAERVTALLARLGSGPVPTPPLETSVPPQAIAVRAFVTNDRGGLDGRGTSLVATLRAQLPGADIEALWVGSPPSDRDRSSLGRAGARRVRWVAADPRVDERQASIAVAARLGDAPSPAVLVFPTTEFGRSVAGRLSGTLGLGLTADVTEIALGADGSVLGIKPSFGGRFEAEIRTRTAPALLTLREERAEPDGPGAPAVAVRGTVTLPPTSLAWEAEGSELAPAERDPRTAPLVVAVGLGVGGPSGLSAVRDLVEPWGAALVGTRKVVDAGWLPRQRQVGLTGLSLAPRLALLVASSGRPNHVIGFRRAGRIVLLTREAETARKAECDLAIVGDFAELLPELDRQGRDRLRSIGRGGG